MSIVAAPVSRDSLYEKRTTIYQAEVDGFWQRLRAAVLFVLAGLYLALPWVRWEQRQAVWFDLPTRKFHFFAVTFWPQDFILLALLMIAGAFGLFFFTNLAGRLWCGFGCPQTVWTRFFMWIEWFTEGDRNQRILLDRRPWSADKFARKAAKHAGWLVTCAVVGFTFVGYFEPIRDLIPRIFARDVTGAETVFLAIASLALYFDAGFMREQICKYACPYARFQGAMFDRHTWTIFYDPRRGEPRGHRGRDVVPAEVGLGHCIDCAVCVQVCPTGIDIRNGTQVDCIGCAACIDACDEVMDKMSYPRGLVRYATEASIEGQAPRVVRPRLVAYGVLFVAVLAVFVAMLAGRVPLQLDVLRDRARLYRVTVDGSIENVYTLKILNMDQHDHVYAIELGASAGGASAGGASAGGASAGGASAGGASAGGAIAGGASAGGDDFVLEGADRAKVAAGEVREVAVRVRAPASQSAVASRSVDFSVRALDDPRLTVTEDSRFLAPAAAAR